MLVELITGPELKIKLKQKNIQQKDICEDLGYNQTTVSRYFTGIQQMPARFIVDVAIYAGFDVDDLVHTDIDPSKITMSDILEADSRDKIAEDPEAYGEDYKFYKRQSEIRKEINDLIKELQNLRRFNAKRRRKSPEKYT